MKRSDDLLREACAELAEEETEALEQSMNRTAIREAEEVYRHHRPEALRLIRRLTAKHSNRRSILLPLAAALVIALGGAMLSLGRPAADPVEQTQLPTEISVQPYYTAPIPILPTSTPDVFPTTFIPPPMPEETITTTSAQIIIDKPTQLPTYAPLATQEPTQPPTPAPTETPAPTSTPAPEILPIAAATDGPAVPIPSGWQGEHFLCLLPPGFELVSVTREDESCTAAYERYGQTLIFTEYDALRLIEAPANADYAYIRIHGETALQVKTDGGVILTWNQDGHTLFLFTPQGDGTDIANSIKKITAR